MSYRKATPAENFAVLLNLHREKFSPAEVSEVEKAISILKNPPQEQIAALREAPKAIAKECSFPADSVQQAVHDLARAALAATRKEPEHG